MADLPRRHGIAGRNVSMPILATRLSMYLKRPVLDQTGLEGFYDFTYEHGSDDPEPDVISCILADLQGIGLKLKSAKGPKEAIVIDQAYKPSKN